MFSPALLFVVVFFLSVLLALWSPRLGKNELIYMLLVHLFVRFALANFCPFSLPLGDRGWLRFVIVAIPGRFYYRFYANDKNAEN